MKSGTFWFGAIATIALVACSSHKTSDGNTAYSTQVGGNTYSLGESVDTSKLGAPVYPGAQMNSGGTMSSKTAQGSNVMVGFKTTDSFDKVVAFYKQQLPQAQEHVTSSDPKNAVTSFELGTMDTPEHTTVLIATDPDGTGIMITHNTKSTAAAASP